MPLYQLKSLLQQAQSAGFALPACRIVDLKGLDAALHAADQASSPMVFQVDASRAGPLGLSVLLPAIEAAAEASRLPLSILMDAADSRQTAVEAIRLGCNGVVIEGDSAEITASAEMARQCDITVVARCVSGETPSAEVVDGLALSDARADLQARDSTALPLLLSDAAGFSLPPLIEAGVALLGMGCAPTPAEILQWIQGCGSADRADALLQTCALIEPVEHLIIYNLSEAASERAEEIMAQGRKVLGRIPGVRKVLTGTAIKQDAQYRLCWLVRFTGPSVIAGYRDHPLHKEYADIWFRPFAADRISIDYRL